MKVPILGMIIFIIIGVVTGSPEWFIGAGLWFGCVWLVKKFGVPQ